MIRLLQTEVTTVICGHKELKKLLDISGQLDTVKRIICMDDGPHHMAHWLRGAVAGQSLHFLV